MKEGDDNKGDFLMCERERMKGRIHSFPAEALQFCSNIFLRTFLGRLFVDLQQDSPIR